MKNPSPSAAHRTANGGFSRNEGFRTESYAETNSGTWAEFFCSLAEHVSGTAMAREGTITMVGKVVAGLKQTKVPVRRKANGYSSLTYNLSKINDFAQA
jgi:hypothetical protein